MDSIYCEILDRKVGEITGLTGAIAQCGCYLYSEPAEDGDQSENRKVFKEDLKDQRLKLANELYLLFTGIDLEKDNGKIIESDRATK